MCSCPAHNALVDCECQCDHTHDRLAQWKARALAAEAEVSRLREKVAWADFTSARGWWNWPLVQWWWYRQYKRRDRRAFRRECAEIHDRAARGDQ